MNVRISNVRNIDIALYGNSSAEDHRPKSGKITEKYFISGNVLF